MKKLFAILVALVLVLGMVVGCTPKTEGPGGDPEGPVSREVKLKVWAAQEEQELLAMLIEEFKAANPDTTYIIETGVVGENDAKTRLQEDAEAAADVFFFAHDQLRDLVIAENLLEVTVSTEDVIARNLEKSIVAASFDDRLYAYPATADNGYFLFYDNSVLSEEDVQTLDGILAKSNEAGKQLMFAVNDSWYLASFFFGMGCTLTVGPNGKAIFDFNSENGIIAAEAIKVMVQDPAFCVGDNAIFAGGIGSTLSAGVTGTWNAAAAKEALGENYAAAKLPTFTTASGEQVQLGSFSGYKLVGVNALTLQPIEAMRLADFLTNEANQAKRFEVRGLGPSNIAVFNTDAVANDIALRALREQSPFSVPQDVPGRYWGAAAAFGNTLTNLDFSVDIPTMLNDLVASILGG
ncbi:MAG: extracellular solute-binding protein [Clostridiales bacterium]|nr:extracellular solute-binding protein [Clostridiales bacterium]